MKQRFLHTDLFGPDVVPLSRRHQDLFEIRALMYLSSRQGLGKPWSLPPVISHRYGFDGYSQKSLSQTGKALELSAEQVRHHESKALSVLHRRFSSSMRQYFGIKLD